MHGAWERVIIEHSAKYNSTRSLDSRGSTEKPPASQAKDPDRDYNHITTGWHISRFY